MNPQNATDVESQVILVKIVTSALFAKLQTTPPKTANDELPMPKANIAGIAKSRTHTVTKNAESEKCQTEEEETSETYAEIRKKKRPTMIQRRSRTTQSRMSGDIDN